MPLARSPSTTIRKTVNGIVTRTLTTVIAEVGLRALVEPQQGERILVEGQGPQAEDREPREAGVLVAE